MSHSSIEVNASTAAFFSAITGMPWPKIREGELRDVRDAYERFAEEMPELREQIAKVAVACLRQGEGATMKAFSEELKSFIGGTGGDDYVTAAGATAKKLADCAADVANAVEYTKWMAIAQLVQLLVEIALAIFWAPFSFGASLSGLVLRKLLTKVALQALMKYLLKTILMHTFAGLVGGLLMDGIIQGIQIGQGNRKEVDKEYTKQAALFGVIGGVLGGPLELLGLGLGKLLGRLIGKSGGKLLADRLSDYLVHGDLQGLKGLLKAAKEAAEKEGRTGSTGLLGKELLAKSEKELAGMAFTKKEAKALARDLGSLLEAATEQLQNGFGKVGRGTLAEIFEKDMGTIFAKHLGDSLGGKEAARALGREFGEAFTRNWLSGVERAALKDGLGAVAKDVAGAAAGAGAKDAAGAGAGAVAKDVAGAAAGAGAKDAAGAGAGAVAKDVAGAAAGAAPGGGLRTALGDVLKGVDPKVPGLSARHVEMLSTHLPDLAEGITGGNRAYHLGLALGGYLQSGAQNVLSEGFYNLIFGEDHEFSVSAGSFLGGVLTGAMGHVLHLGAHPVMARYQQWVHDKQYEAVAEGASEYFPLHHPISFAALASLASGKIVPFPVPRMGHPGSYEVAKLRHGTLDDLADAVGHASGKPVTSPPADSEVAELIQSLLDHVDLLEGDHPGGTEPVVKVPTESAEHLDEPGGNVPKPPAGQPPTRSRDEDLTTSTHTSTSTSTSTGGAAGETPPPPPPKAPKAPTQSHGPVLEQPVAAPVRPVPSAQQQQQHVTAQHQQVEQQQQPSPQATVVPEVPVAPDVPSGPPRAAFGDAAWQRPRRGLPEDWSDAEARLAAHRIATTGVPEQVGERVGDRPPPLVFRGEHAGVKVNVRVEDGLITDVWGEPHQRPPHPSGGGSPTVLGTREIRPPANPLARSTAERRHESFQATRLRYPDGDTETLLTLRVHLDTRHLDPAAPDTAKALEALRQRARQGVADTYDLGQRLPGGDRLRVEVEFTDRPEDAHHTATVHPGAGREDLTNWNLHSDATTLAHELGHALGLADEYREAGAGPRPVYPDSGLMGTWYRDGRDRPLLDLDRTGTTPGTDAPRGVLRARNLRQLGATVDAAFGPAPSPHPDLPARARFGEDTRRTALYGGPNGGGHLYAPAGSGRERPAPVPGGGHRNGTFRVVGGPAEHLRPRPNDPAGDLAGARHRTVFPEHWTADDAVYAAEQAYQHALRTGNTTRTGPYAYHWEGEYAGVRIEGEVKAGEFTSFRPADRQSDLDTPAYAPWHSTRQPFDLRGDDLLQYGDRHTMTGAHHAPTPAAAAAHGIRIERLPEPARPNGTYRATVHYLDPTIAPGAPLARQDTHWHTPAGAPPHTMYPEHWTLADVHAAVEEAYRNRRDPRPPGTGAEHWVGEARGVRIEGVTRDGRHLVHRPTDDQPGTPAPTHRSAPLREPATPGTGHRPPTATPAPLPAQPPHPDLRRAAPTPPQTPHAPHVPGNDLPEPGRRIDVPDDGLCLLHAVGVSAPELVAGHPLREKATARRLIDRIAAHFGSLDLAAVPPDIIRMVRARDLGQQQYYHREELRQLLTPGQRAAADGHSYQDLRLQALTGLFERSNPNWTQELSREALLAHLAPEDRAAAADLDHARLAELVREQTRRSDETMLPSERTGLLRAINAWAWNSDYGDSFPALVAHALNLRLRVIPVGPGADQLVGPENGRPLAIYRDGARVHYQASEPPPHPLLSALAAADPALVRKAARPHPATGPAPDPVRVLREAIADYLNTDNRRLPQDLLALVRPGGRHLAPEPTGNLSHHQALTELRRRFGDPDDPLSPTESDLLPSLLAHALDIRFRPTDESPDTVGPAHAPLVELGHPPKDRRAEEETAKAKAKAEAEEAARVLREREEKLAREREEAKAKAEEAARVLREREREEAEAKEREKKEQQGERQEDGEALRAKERAEQEQARLRRAKERAEQERARLRRVEEREEAARLQRVRREEDERARQQEAAEKLRAERAEQERARLEREKEREKARAEAQEKQRLAEEKRERLEREEAEDAARPPKTVIDGGDLVLALSANEVALRQKVIEVLVAKAKGDRDAVRAFAEAYFGPAVLRPILAAVSRGETWRAPFRGNGWSGEVVLRGKLARAERRKGRTKIEFENGADRSVAVGGRAEKQWQFAVGGQLRHTNDDIQLAELVGYFHDRGEGETHVEVSGVVARSKTSVDAVVYDSTMALELDFSGLRHHRAPVRPDAEAAVERVEVGLTVAAPRYQAPPKDVELVPPSRLARDGRIGGQEIVLELTPRARQSDAGQSDAVPKTPVELLLDAVWAEATAQVRENWPALRAKILAEVDFARLHHELKSATAGEPITVVLTDADGEPLARVDITAKVRDLRVVGVTDPTEFNIGTVVQQVSGSQRSRGHAGQFPLFPTTGPALGDGIVNGGANQRHAREGVVIEGSSLTSQLTSKAKVPGVLYEGTVEFTVSFNGKEGKPAGAADVRLLVDRRDTEERSLLPKPETVPATVPETGNVEAASTHRILGPADDVWANGLDDTVVVRDLEGTAALREALDAKGAERYGKDWPRIREEVLATVNLPRLAAHMTALSRGESVEVKLGGKDGIVVTFTAELDRLTHRRVDDEAELNPVSETNAFSEVRGLSSRTDTLHFQAGGKGKDSASGIGVEVTPVGSAQQRAREGWRDRSNERVVANGKYKLPQVLYGAELTVRVEVDVKGRKATAGEKVTVEIGLDKTSTVERELPKGQKDFERPKPKEPQSDANENANANENADGGKKPGEDEDKKPDDQPPVPVLPSRVKSRNELNASYVVHSLGSTADVRAKVKAIIGAKHTLTAEHASRIDRAFKHLVLKGQLSRLSRGAKLTETVGGRLWSAEIVLTAKVREPVAGGEGKAPVPPRPVKGYEFESGSRASRGQGYVQDRVLRGTGGVQAKVKALALEGAVGHVQRRDQTHGEAADVVGSVSNRGKHVEDAAVFDLDAVYDVEVRFTWMGREDGPPVTDSASVRARVAVPLRDAVADTVPKVRPEDTEAQAAAKRAAAAEAEARKLAESLERDRLDSSAIVTDVHSVTEPGEGPRRTLGESLVDQLEDGPRRWKDAAEQRRPGWTAEGWQRAKDAAAEVGRLAKGLFASRDWARMRAELEGELTPDRLQARLKGMLAGDRKPLRIGSVTVETGAVLVGRLEHLGAAGTTEFNAGTDVQHGFADSGSETHSGTGRGHSTNLGGAGTVPGTVPVTIGLAGNYGRGRDWIEAQAKSVASGSASKAKVPGSAYRGEAELQFTITWKPRFGRKVVLRTTARVGFETLIETAETGPVVKPAASGAKEGPALPYKPGPEQAVRVPPERVWKEGLGDTDVLRWLGDVGGLQDMVRELEVKHFGGSTDTARSVTSHSYLSALFSAATRGTDPVSAGQPGSWPLGGDKSLELGVKILELDYQGKDAKIELSPANGFTAGASGTALSSSSGGGQLRVGLKFADDFSHSPALLLGAQRTVREGGGQGGTGQTVSNGKYPTEMARYSGYARIEAVALQGGKELGRSSGVLPFTVDIPFADTSESKIPSDTFLAFSETVPEGDLRFNGDPRILEDAWELLYPRPNQEGAPRTPLDAETRGRLAGLVQLGRAAYGTDFTVHSEAGRHRIWTVHRLAEAAGGARDQLNGLIRELLPTKEPTEPTNADIRRLLEKVERWLSRRHGGQRLTPDELRAAARNDWRVEDDILGVLNPAGSGA